MAAHILCDGFHSGYGRQRENFTGRQMEICVSPKPDGLTYQVRDCGGCDAPALASSLAFLVLPALDGMWHKPQT